MGTNYYLADNRYMLPEERATAERFSEETFICRRAGKGGSLEYTLGVHSTYLFDAPRDTRIVNDNNSSIATLGELLDAMCNWNTTVILSEDAAVKDAEHVEAWFSSLPNDGAWGEFRGKYESVSVKIRGVEKYFQRIE